MLPEESYRLLIFTSLIVAVYVFAFGALIRLALDYFAIVKITKNPLWIWIGRISLTLAVIGLFCFGYAYFIEPYWLEVRKIEIKSAKMPPGNAPLRIVHISDIHSDPQVRLEESLPRAIAEQKPDLIIFSGDSINSPAGLPVFKKCLTEISKIAPTFVVRGNWDTDFWSNEDLFGGTGAKELNATTEKLKIRGAKIWVAGIPVDREGKIPELLNSIPPNEFSIFVFHYPDEIEEVAKRNIDLYCAGHTHGGQIALPLYGALVTLSKYGKRFEGGTYRVGQTWLNVNRGIGMEGGRAPRVRFWARPEITVIDILPE